MPAGREDRPGIGIAKQLVGDPLHVDEVFGICADAAEDAENRLHEKWRLDQPPFEEVREVIEVADIVALELEPSTATLAQILQYPLNVGERVAEDEIAGHLQMLRLPRVLPVFVPAE